MMAMIIMCYETALYGFILMVAFRSLEKKMNRCFVTLVFVEN